MEEWRAYSVRLADHLRAETRRADKYSYSFRALDDVITKMSSQKTPLLAPASRPMKPELPPIDLWDVETWLRRLEAAYARASVVTPADKLSYLEGKKELLIPALDVYFHNPRPTEAIWEQFKAYLIERYAKTDQQRARELLPQNAGWRREGRTPIDYVAFMKKQMGTLTIKDLQKEMLFREMPQEVNHI